MALVSQMVFTKQMMCFGFLFCPVQWRAISYTAEACVLTADVPCRWLSTETYQPCVDHGQSKRDTAHGSGNIDHVDFSLVALFSGADFVLPSGFLT